jgi:AraC-like DNA-binding protein
MHDEFGVGRLRSGAQKSRSGRGMVEAGAGDLITCNPGEVHDGCPIGEGRSWSMLYFDPSIVLQSAAEIRPGTRDLEFERPRLRDAVVASRFETLFAAVTDARAAELWDPEEALLELLAALTARYREPPPSASQAVLDVVRRIDGDPGAPIEVRSLAADAGISTFGLIRGFRAATGMTPHAYLVQRRLQLARQQIRRGLPLAQAAAAAGFADQAHLTRLFARSYGVTPGRYAQAFA